MPFGLDNALFQPLEPQARVDEPARLGAIPHEDAAARVFRRVARVDADALEAGHVKQQRIPAIERALFHGTKI